MAKVTKKAIRKELRRARSLHAGQGTYAYDFRMYWRKRMKPQGVPGYSYEGGAGFMGLAKVRINK